MKKSQIEYFFLNTPDELRQRKMQWDSLEVRAAQKSAMLSYAWITNYLEYFVLPEQSWICVVAVSDDRLIAVLPLLLEKPSWPAPHVFGRSAFGGHLNITDILSEKDLEGDVLPGLLKYAFDEYPSLGYIELPRVPADSPTLEMHLPKSAPLVMFKNEKSCGYFLSVPDDYSEYEKSLSRNFRSNLKKATNKLTKLDSVEFEFLRSDVEPEKCLKRFCDIERSGWKGRSGTAIGQSDRLIAFYSAVFRDLKEIDLLEWHFLKSGDQDLAGHMAFRLQDKLVLWKLAYNESFSACSPGGQLMRELIRRESEDKRSKEIDLTTDQTWYTNWNLVQRPYFRVRVYNRRYVRSLLLLYIERMRDVARNNRFIQRIQEVKNHLLRSKSKD